MCGCVCIHGASVSECRRSQLACDVCEDLFFNGCSSVIIIERYVQFGDLEKVEDASWKIYGIKWLF